MSRKQVAWLNIKYVTEEALEPGVKVINAYNKFGIAQLLGSGKHASADGTKWNLYEQNLISEHHIRYGGYGGMAITMSRTSSSPCSATSFPVAPTGNPYP